MGIAVTAHPTHRRTPPRLRLHLPQRPLLNTALHPLIDQALQPSDLVGAVLVATNKVADVFAGVGIAARPGLAFDPRPHRVGQGNLDRRHGGPPGAS